jgi:hypothetical protein
MHKRVYIVRVELALAACVLGHLLPVGVTAATPRLFNCKRFCWAANYRFCPDRLGAAVISATALFANRAMLQPILRLTI